MPTPSTYHLFVYGSLRSGFKSEMYTYISQFFNFVSNAKVKGKLYDLGEYPAATPTKEDAYIVGELYVIKNQHEFSWAIGQLDDYEGVSVEAHEVQLYRREIADIFYNDKVTPAWIYWYNGDVNGKPIITAGDILQYINTKK
jgi:gamma-glutamylcyclotransferase (GGCT)/AIG2-like uncharacterized protein YtfP